jgi:hypothetical protein
MYQTTKGTEISKNSLISIAQFGFHVSLSNAIFEVKDGERDNKI